MEEINNEPKIIKSIDINNRASGISLAGAIINIISVVPYLMIILPSIAFGSLAIILIILPAILTLIINCLYIGNTKYAVSAGVLGILFAGVLGGIFILVGKK